MKLPTFLYGRGRDARRETRKIITRLRRGLTLPEAVDELGGLIEVAEHPGWVILGGPSQLAGARDGFHLYRLLAELEERHHDEILEPHEEALFASLISREWGVALLMSSRGSYFVLNHEKTLANGRYHRLLDAACEHWPAFESIGPRWSESGSQLDRPLPCSRTLEIVLLHCNIPFEVIQAEQQLGLPELLRRHPPEPEKYTPPSAPPQPRAAEEKRAWFISTYSDYYRSLVEDFDLPPKHLRSTRELYDEDVLAEGLDPADLDPYWNQRD